MRWNLLLAAAALLSAPMVGRAADAYLLQPEDALTISVYGHDELGRDVVVLRDGDFNYPIVGRVSAAGKSPEDVATVIAAGLSRELVEPHVTVSVRQPAMRRVYVSGLVSKAGSYDLKPGWRVSHVLAEAGGLSTKPELAKAVIVRGVETIPVDLNAVLTSMNRDADLELQPGDLVQVQADTNLVHVAGQVKTPGDYQVKSSLGILEAVAMAGGATDDAALTRAQIIRGAQVLKVDLHAMLVEGKTDGNVALQPGDTLVVPANEARIAVLGGVGQPGYYDLPDGKAVTVVDALGMAKGSLKYAKMNEVALVRMVDGKQVVSTLNVSRFLKEGDLSQNPAVSTGDVIYVKDGEKDFKPSNILSAIMTFTNPILYSVLRR
jgi:polysaccharide export outer membrane protein